MLRCLYDCSNESNRVWKISTWTGFEFLTYAIDFANGKFLVITG